MSNSRLSSLTAEKARIFRITHRRNIPWIAKNGLHCATAGNQKFASIGNPDLISKRFQRRLPKPYHGVLADYVPFYFTPFSPMMYNIHTGFNVAKQSNDDIVIIVSNLHALRREGVDFVFTDRHAYLELAKFFHELNDLNHVDWDILQRKDFRRDPNDPGKIERYQAEALARTHVPVTAIGGIVCYCDSVAEQVQNDFSKCEVEMPVRVRKGWYF